jgi:hypothetical protein
LVIEGSQYKAELLTSVGRHFCSLTSWSMLLLSGFNLSFQLLSPTQDSRVLPLLGETEPFLNRPELTTNPRLYPSVRHVLLQNLFPLTISKPQIGQAGIRAAKMQGLNKKD